MTAGRAADADAIRIMLHQGPRAPLRGIELRDRVRLDLDLGARA